MSAGTLDAAIGGEPAQDTTVKARVSKVIKIDATGTIVKPVRKNSKPPKKTPSTTGKKLNAATAKNQK